MQKRTRKHKLTEEEAKKLEKEVKELADEIIPLIRAYQEAKESSKKIKTKSLLRS